MLKKYLNTSYMNDEKYQSNYFVPGYKTGNW